MNQEKYCQTISELIRAMNAKTAKLTHQQYARQNLTAQQINILLLLNKQQSMRVSDIGKILNMPDSNVSTVCSRLEEMGLTERVRQKEDQRVVKVQLTSAAQSRMCAIKSMAAAFQNLVYRNVAEKDLQDIVLGLTKYNRLLDLALIKNSDV